jgi:hypothetical protein
MAVAVHGQAILENERRHASLLEPFRLVDAFVVKGQHGVGAAGTDEDGGSRLARVSGKKNRQGGDVVRGGSMALRGRAIPQWNVPFGGDGGTGEAHAEEKERKGETHRA